MVSGQSLGGEYFIDCSVSQSVGRAIFGAWLTICVTVMGMCARSIYRSQLRRRVFTPDIRDASRQKVSPWVISPPNNPSEVLNARNILLWAVKSRREFSFILCSLACIFVAIITAASTAIANQTVVSNILTRRTAIQGQLSATGPDQPPLGFATVEMDARIKALDNANFPIEELLDFVPYDTSGWVYSAGEWNNSWHGHCAYDAHHAVDLTIFPTNSTRSQDEVPGLTALLPPWVSDNSTTQKPFHSGIGSDDYANDSIVWKDMLVTWVHLGQLDSERSTFNVSLVNFLVDQVGAFPGGGYIETGFRSDVYVAGCVFENSNPTQDYRATPGRNAEDAVDNIAWVYEVQTENDAIADKPIVQPTGQQMLRYWQAYTSILNTQYPHEVQRYVAVSRPITQIRLSVLATTVCALFFMLLLALLYHVADLRRHAGKRIMLPSSSFGWVMQAAHERQQRRGGTTVLLSTPAAFVLQHSDLTLVAGRMPDDRWRAPCVSSIHEEAGESGLNGTETDMHYEKKFPHN